MESKIVERIAREADTPGLFAALAHRLSLTDLQSLLLEVYRQRSEGRTPGETLQQYRENRFVQPATANPRRLLALDQLAFSLLPAGFEVLELSPVCPFGTNSSVATVSQNKAVTTTRNTEVVSDATNVLALESACRILGLPDRNAASRPPVKLCASHRCLRPQFSNTPGMSPHFRLLSLVTAGRDTGSYQFETDAMTEHLTFYLRLLDATRQAGFSPGAVRVTVTAFDPLLTPALQERVLGKLTSAFPTVAFAFDPERTHGRGYYKSAGFHLYVSDGDGKEYFLTDGGFTDWTQRLLDNRKERLLISGMGSERFVSCFGGTRTG